ncbi:pigment epithelium-derived factor-like [Acipenser oxyrinchus oxyrinchus]|uniref:Pigment epithelium-derived factor-like n=1 Tax=Acipenser oxyrinchus oxyrinchus TaxID=40147 RepID=A0AAD8FZH2_ACIOX|nr:pigment epithelium-derived factor-like [Acipenser oxyrinchus oxyrinchus]
MKTTALALFMGALLSLASTQQADPEEPTPVEEEEVEIFTTPATQMAAAASNFGFNLYRQLAYQDPKANVFLSPLSIASALTQLSLGGAPRTEQQLYRVLQYHHLMDPHLHSTLKDLLASVNTPSKGLSMASRVYIDKKLRLKVNYLNAVEKEYGVRPKALNGSPRADLKEVNDWVRQQTGGKIAHFLSASLPRNMGVLPLGAAHFRGQWVSRLQKGRPEPFQVDSWTSIQVPMMSETKYPVKLGIESDLNCKITQVPMQGDVSMLLFLPNEVSQNLTLIEESLTAEFIHDVVSVLQPVDIDLSLPALSLSSENNLLPQLLDMGLAQLASQPELVKISTLPGKVSSVHHKVSLEVMEEGGQAASSSPSGSGLSLALSFHVNRPFIFLVRDDTSGAILFIGRVMDPRKLKRN